MNMSGLNVIMSLDFLPFATKFCHIFYVMRIYFCVEVHHSKIWDQIYYYCIW